jgi:hypothetical protein
MPKAERAESLTLDVALAAAEAFYGCTIPVDVPVFGACSECGGTGQVFLFRCLGCAGSELLEQQRAGRPRAALGPAWDGSGGAARNVRDPQSLSSGAGFDFGRARNTVNFVRSVECKTRSMRIDSWAIARILHGRSRDCLARGRDGPLEQRSAVGGEQVPDVREALHLPTRPPGAIERNANNQQPETMGSSRLIHTSYLPAVPLPPPRFTQFASSIALRR